MHGWEEEFAVFYAAYPTRDPMKCTISTFFKLVDMAPKTCKLLQGRYVEADQHADALMEDNRRIIMKRRLPSFFPPQDDEVDDG